MSRTTRSRPGRAVCTAVLPACLLMAGCNNQEPAGENAAGNAPAPATLYTVLAGPVTGDRITGIGGTFRLDESTGPDAIESNLLGGACIIFRAEDLGYTEMAGKTCHNDNQCKTGEGQGYCEKSTNKCWARPIVNPPTADPLCRRSINTGMPWPPDTDIPISTNPIPIGAYNLKPNSQAAVVACLRGTNPGTASACGFPDSVIKWSQPATIP